MLPRLLSLCISLVFGNALFAQIPLPQAAEISTGQVTARISTNGALIDDFLVPAPSGDSLISLLGEISLWVGGKDQGNSLFWAIQRKDSMTNDFVSGFRGVPQSQGIWKVTKGDLQAHLADFQDNGHIDNPIPAIYAWPGAGNPYSMLYNGFATDTLDSEITASFQDANDDGIYNPDDGDFPFGTQIGIFHSPTDLLFTPFYVNMKNPHHVHEMPLDCSMMLFSYDCDDANFLESAVFCRVSSVNKSTEPMDSFLLAFYIDGNIGGAHDDYMGSLYNSVAYFYNADSYDEGGFGASPPMLAFHTYTVLLDEMQMAVSPNSITTIHPSYELPPPLAGTDDPMQDIEYYRYMDGKWRDGLHLAVGGNGRGGTQATSFIYPGNPANPGEWSETSAQTLAGDRRAVLSSGPVTLLPNAHNHSLFSLTSVPPNPIVVQMEAMSSYLTAQFEYFYVDFFPPDPTPFDTITCLHLISTQTVFEHPAQLFPNPASHQVTLQTETADIATITIYSILGAFEYSECYSNSMVTTVQVPLVDVPPGLHLLQCVWKDGYRKTWKMLVE